MTPRHVWERMHAEFGVRLGCPCGLQFSEEVITANHRFEDDGTCLITINPTLDFQRPEHLVLHEFAHHRALVPYFHQGDMEIDHECCLDGHCEHWAQTLVDMYRETSTEFPFSTMFESFATLAEVKHKAFDYFNAKNWSK